MLITPSPQILINNTVDVLKSKGHLFFENGDYNLNLIAIRENDTFENTFSDKLQVIYKENGKNIITELPWTSLAGVYGHGGEKDPYTSAETGTPDAGVAIMLEGQYRSAFKWVTNGWRYPFTRYFQQVGGLDYLRDNDKNGLISRETAKKVYNQNYSTHLHPMSLKGVSSNFVSAPGYLPWSAGCNGTDAPNFDKLDYLAEQAVKRWGRLFTYTLLHRNDFK